MLDLRHAQLRVEVRVDHAARGRAHTGLSISATATRQIVNQSLNQSINQSQHRILPLLCVLLARSQRAAVVHSSNVFDYNCPFLLRNNVQCSCFVMTDESTGRSS